jgi:hypothetical protein
MVVDLFSWRRTCHATHWPSLTMFSFCNCQRLLVPQLLVLSERQRSLRIPFLSFDKQVWGAWKVGITGEFGWCMWNWRDLYWSTNREDRVWKEAWWREIRRVWDCPRLRKFLYRFLVRGSRVIIEPVSAITRYLPLKVVASLLRNLGYD